MTVTLNLEYLLNLPIWVYCVLGAIGYLIAAIITAKLSRKFNTSTDKEGDIVLGMIWPIPLFMLTVASPFLITYYTVKYFVGK